MANGDAPGTTETPPAAAAGAQTAQTPAAPAKPAAKANTLQVSRTGDLATVSGSGLEPGLRVDVKFTRPDDREDSTIAHVDAEGNVTTYARCYLSGKYTVKLLRDGEELASADFKV